MHIEYTVDVLQHTSALFEFAINGCYEHHKSSISQLIHSFSSEYKEKKVVAPADGQVAYRVTFAFKKWHLHVRNLAPTPRKPLFFVFLPSFAPAFQDLAICRWPKPTAVGRASLVGQKPVWPTAVGLE